MPSGQHTYLVELCLHPEVVSSGKHLNCLLHFSLELDSPLGQNALAHKRPHCLLYASPILPMILRSQQSNNRVLHLTLVCTAALTSGLTLGDQYTPGFLPVGLAPLSVAQIEDCDLAVQDTILIT